MTKGIAFLGFGTLAVQLIELFDLNVSGEVQIFDDVAFGNKVVNAHPFNLYNDELSHYTWALGLGYKHLEFKRAVIAHMIANNVTLLGGIHSSCFISNRAHISDGAFIYPMCNVDRGVKIGHGTLLNNSVTISHDSTIGMACYLSPGVVLSGNCCVGNATFLGSGAVVANGVKIGNNCIIGIGSVIAQDVPDNVCLIGNPARQVKSITLL